MLSRRTDNMIKANLDAEISALEKELYSVDQDIWKIANIISGLNKQLEILRSNKVAIETKLDDLSDQMEVE